MRSNCNQRTIRIPRKKIGIIKNSIRAKELQDAIIEMVRELKLSTLEDLYEDYKGRPIRYGINYLGLLEDYKALIIRYSIYGIPGR